MIRNPCRSTKNEFIIKLEYSGDMLLNKQYYYMRRNDINIMMSALVNKNSSESYVSSI